METEKKYKILIVDDIPKNIELAANILKTKNYNITYAKNGPSAIDKVKSIDFDLILLDVMMPGMDGFEVCEVLKRDPKTRSIPVIFLTAKSETGNVVKGFELGAVDYVTKPFKTEELLARVNNHIGIKTKLEEKERIENELNRVQKEQESFLSEMVQQQQSGDAEEKRSLADQLDAAKKIEKELELKSEEIRNVTLFYELRSQLDKLIQDRSPVARMEIKQVKEMISKLFIDKSSQEFHRSLKSNYPKLTFDDLRLCSYLKQRFLNIEIAEFLETSPEAIYTRKSRLRQKLNLTKEQDLDDFLSNYAY